MPTDKQKYNNSCVAFSFTLFHYAPRKYVYFVILPRKSTSTNRKCFQEISKYKNLCDVIRQLDTLVTFPLVRLDCSDLKRGLSDKAKHLGDMLLHKIASDHRAENIRWVSLGPTILVNRKSAWKYTFLFSSIDVLYEVFRKFLKCLEIRPDFLDSSNFFWRQNRYFHHHTFLISVRDLS